MKRQHPGLGPVNAHVGRQIMLARSERGMSQRELGLRAFGRAISPRIGSYENNTRAISVDSLNRIAAALGMHPAMFLPGRAVVPFTRTEMAQYATIAAALVTPLVPAARERASRRKGAEK